VGKTLSTTELRFTRTQLLTPGHNHTQNPHTHSYNAQGTAGGLGVSFGGSISATTTGATTATNNPNATGITGTDNAGSGSAFSIVPPTLVANCIIRLQ